MSVDTLCELCGERGVGSKLVPYQINLDEAILLCENSQCFYTLSSSGWKASCFTLQRKASDISNLKRKKKKKHSAKSKVLTVTNGVKKAAGQDVFIQWQNEDALCWLDSVLNMLVHNRTISHLIQTSTLEESKIKYLISSFKRALNMLADKLTEAKDLLNNVRMALWTYLKPKMQCELGVNDSPIYALPLLLRENSLTAERCLQEVSWHFSCVCCGATDITRLKKHLITLPNTPDDFSFPQASFVKRCATCGSQNQKSVLKYDRAPCMVLLHFVEGLKTADYLDNKFELFDKQFEVTQFVQYTRNPDHFVCWTRQYDGSKWMELDDLKSHSCTWSSERPEVPPSEVHILVCEPVVNNNMPLIETQIDTTDVQSIDSGICSLSEKRNLHHPRESLDLLDTKDIKKCQNNTPSTFAPESLALTTSTGSTCTTTECDSPSSSTYMGNDRDLEAVSNSELCERLEAFLKSVVDNPVSRPKMQTQELHSQPCPGEDYVVSEVNPSPDKTNHNKLTVLTSGGHNSDSVAGHTDSCSSQGDHSIYPLTRAQSLAAQASLENETLTSDTQTSPTTCSTSFALTRRALKDISGKRQVASHHSNLYRKRTSAHFQPYVPKKLRTSATTNDASQSICMDSCSALWKAVTEDEGQRASQEDSPSDSGYSSPGSVSSCASSQHLVTLEKVPDVSREFTLLNPDKDNDINSDKAGNEECNGRSLEAIDLVAEINDLLPDCLLGTSRTPSPVTDLDLDFPAKHELHKDSSMLLSLVA